MTSDEQVGLMGFFQAKETDGHALYAGYLVLDHRGDAVEFCWSDNLMVSKLRARLSSGHFVPNRLEELALALLAQSKHHPLVVLTNQTASLKMRHTIRMASICKASPTKTDGLLCQSVAIQPDIFVLANNLEAMDAASRCVRHLADHGISALEIFGKIDSAIQEVRAGKA